jgi:hypothetical protein
MKLTDRTRAAPGDDNVVTCEPAGITVAARELFTAGPAPSAAMIEATWQDRPDAAKTAKES